MMNREIAKQRATELVKQMTVEEMASQLRYDAPAIPRLQIPEYNWWNESLHGVARAGTATVFPQAIGLGATFDKDLLFEIKNQGYGKARMRKASQYCVQIYNQLFDTLYGAGIIKEITSDIENFYELVDEEMYTDDKGLNLSVESGMDLYL